MSPRAALRGAQDDRKKTFIFLLAGTGKSCTFAAPKRKQTPCFPALKPLQQRATRGVSDSTIKLLHGNMPRMALCGPDVYSSNDQLPLRAALTGGTLRDTYVNKWLFYFFCYHAYDTTAR
jgi:hypothetical protein